MGSVPPSNGTFTHVIITRAFLENLYSSFSLPLPDEFKTPKGPLLSRNDTLPFNFGEEEVAYVGAMLPSGISEEEVAYVGAFVLCTGITIFNADLSPVQFGDTGWTHMLHDYSLTTSGSGNGWVGLETALVRLSDPYAPGATFPVWSTVQERPTILIGYDAVVCVEMCEPWIVQIYNSSLGIPTTMSIVNKSATTDFETDDGNRGPRLDSYTRVLNSTDKDLAYSVRYAGSFSFERY